MIRALRRRIVKQAPRQDLREDERGNTAIEFALIGAPFLGLLMAIIEVALVFFVTQAIDTGVTNASRQIRTGQAQAMTENEFKDVICESISVLVGDCRNAVKVDVEVLENFGGANGADDLPLDGDGNLDEGQLDYDPGESGDIVIVRGMVEWPTFIPNILDVANMGNGNRLVMSTVTFRNEPF